MLRNKLLYDEQCLTNKATTVDVDTQYHPFFESHSVASELKHTDGHHELLLCISFKYVELRPTNTKCCIL